MIITEPAEHHDASDAIDCREALAVLHEYLRKECGVELERKVEAHLERCRACFASASFERNYFRLLAEHADRIRCPDALRARVLDALGRH
jgi:anti-sigma factor (TIGR02949 family)